MRVAVADRKSLGRVIAFPGDEVVRAPARKRDGDENRRREWIGCSGCGGMNALLAVLAGAFVVVSIALIGGSSM
jgi:hypothetical protein